MKHTRIAIRLIFSKSFLLCFITCFVLPAPGFSEEIYRFERMWPTLPQPWYFSYPVDVTCNDQGYIYLVDQYNNRIRKFTPDGAFITSWGKEGAAEGQFRTPTSIAVDSNGFVYVADTMNNRIQKFSADGFFIKFWGAPGSENGQFYNPAGITVDAGNSIYVADTWNHRIQKFTDNGTFIISWGEQGSGPGEFEYPAGITVDSKGRIWVADQYNNRIQKFTASGSFASAWGEQGFSAGAFSLPWDIVAGRDGQLYVTDQGNHRIQKFTDNGTFVTAWGRQGTQSAELQYPSGITVDLQGSIVVADTSNNCVQKFSSNGRFLAKWGSTGADSGKFFQPIGIAVAPNNTVFVADSRNNRIQKFKPTGEFRQRWGGLGDVPGRFNEPKGITLDPHGRYVYVVDMHNNRIQKFTINGEFKAAWGVSGSGNGEFSLPYGIAIDSSGFVYIADTGNNRIQKFTDNGTFITTWGYEGTGNGQFQNPYCVAADSRGFIYVPDNWNHRIQKFTTDGLFIKAWGSNGKGIGQFDYPTGIAVDADGAVLIADTGNHRIQKFTDNGTFLTTWGSFGSDPLQMSYPDAVAVSPSGNVYVSDTENNRVQVFTKVSLAAHNKAVIVAGGGPYPGNNIWNETQTCANFACRTLLYQGFTKDEIYYLSSDTDLDLDGNGLADDVDDNATGTNLEYALTIWAQDADNLFLYLVDHGGDGTFRMSEGELLASRSLDLWLDRLQRKIAGRVTVIYDACESGSFVADLKPPRGKERIVATSTAPGESAYFITLGAISFSNYFWTQVFNGLTLYDAFTLARQAISYTTPYQNALLDDNGDGAGDTSDGALAKSTHIGNGTVLSLEAPVIERVSPEQTISDNNTAWLYADVTDTDNVTRVWAVIRPPDFAPGSSDNPVQQLPSLDLQQPSAGAPYVGSYTGFTSPGTYQVCIYAMDSNLNTSVPKLTKVTVQSPLSKKAIIVAGAFQADQELKSALEKNAVTAYEALRFQGYRDEDMYFMAQSSFHPGVDGLATLDNIEYAITGWAPESSMDMIFYFIGVGDNSSFAVNATETLSAGQLGTWLNAAQQKLPGIITFIYDGCLSGSFIPLLAPPSGTSRILITSTGSDQPAYFLSDGDISFSGFFWGKIANGSKVRGSFGYASNAISFACGNQVPLLDDNGNGIANEYDDGSVAKDYALGMGVMLAGDDPVIGSVSPEQTLNGLPAARLWADGVTATGSIQKVWALITPPDGISAQPSASITELPSVVLQPSLSGRYETTYAGFSVAGDYRISIFAMDSNGNISLPLNTAVHQMQDSACPAALLAGGENNTTGLLRQFRDTILRRSSYGQSCVQLFYKHAPEITAILQSDPGLMTQCQEILHTMLPLVQAALNNEMVSIAQPDAIIVLSGLEAIAAKAAPVLREDIKNLQDDIREDKIMSLINH